MLHALSWSQCETHDIRPRSTCINTLNNEPPLRSRRIHTVAKSLQFWIFPYSFLLIKFFFGNLIQAELDCVAFWTQSIGKLLGFMLHEDAVYNWRAMCSFISCIGLQFDVKIKLLEICSQKLKNAANNISIVLFKSKRTANSISPSNRISSSSWDTNDGRMISFSIS